MWSCALQGGAPDPEHSVHNRGVTVALPFIDMAQIYGQGVNVRNPVTSKVFFTGQVEEDGAGVMSNALYRLIGQEKDLLWGAYADPSLELKAGPGDVKMDHLAQLRSIGRRQNADTVLAGYLYAFRDRTGSSFGAQRPAQVAFELVLISVDSGRIVWQRSFKETQKALSEDLMKLGAFIKRRGRWVNAREMGVGALKEMVNTIPPAGRP
jgi:hypothetical protein